MSNRRDKEVVIGPGVKKLLPNLGLTEDEVKAVVSAAEHVEYFGPDKTRAGIKGSPTPGKCLTLECVVEQDSGVWHVVYVFEE